ncbi:hypothetical protein HAX54_006335 [Datura stramonium]|uniref:Uncharacterized protein n=1 Tax=Datura stramonium TaxID=4076 RepID=A0ABS8TA56_DATST|nr:hypothetical protein [Datura stramonium]
MKTKSEKRKGGVNASLLLLCSDGFTGICLAKGKWFGNEEVAGTDGGRQTEIERGREKRRCSDWPLVVHRKRCEMKRREGGFGEKREIRRLLPIGDESAGGAVDGVLGKGNNVFDFHRVW